MAYRRIRAAFAALASSLLAFQPPAAASPQAFVVVIDAGHGGHDPGSLSPWGQGDSEKTVTLAIAKAIRAALVSRQGIAVVLTRSDDRFLRLSQRRRIAEGRHADLFVSIHVDSAPNSSARGASVYTLTEDGRGLVVGRMAGAGFGESFLAGLDPDTSEVLGDIRERSAMNLAARFAARLGASLAPAVQVRPAFQHVAAFAVLKARGIPAALIETGYVTNRGDAGVLFSHVGQQRIARAIARAIVQTAEDDRGRSGPNLHLASRGVWNGDGKD